MTDMQLIRYRACGPGRWVREVLHRGVPSWLHTHDVRTKQSFVDDMEARWQAGEASRLEIVADEVRRYAGGALGP